MVHFDLHASSNEGVISMGGIIPEERKDSNKLQCFPLASLLLALDNPTVHYFSLDIEGAELGVLESLPWQLLDIWVISVETHLAGVVFPGTREDIIKLMESVGYSLVEWSDRDTEKDDLFVRNDVHIEFEGWRRKKMPCEP